MTPTQLRESSGAPAWGLLGVEPMRAVLEYASMKLMDRTGLPPGDGHPVVIFPGLAADRHATAPLQQCCEELGYHVYDWGRGRNIGPLGDVDEWLAELGDHVRELTRAHAEPVSLVGWSLGGIYARELAKQPGARVRQVITIGTPFAGTVDQTNVGWIYRLLNGQAPAVDAALSERLRTAPSVPTTSIFSRTDGVVAWEACIQRGGRQTENIEVDSSHCGLVWNPEVLAIVADRLRQPRNRWQRHARAMS
jgi:alpha-beta hydrolase superfamily lysophospholipase